MNNENNLENIKTKIKKLLALSKSDNENEAYIALKKANDLINEYKLDENSLRFESLMVKSTKTYIPYRAVISNAVAWLYGCHTYRCVDKKSFVFTGESLYVFLAGEMFTYLINSINRCAKKSIHKNAKRKYRISFKYGMADRIYDRIMELGKSCSWAPYRDDNIKDAEKFIVQSTTLYSELKVKEILFKLDEKAITKGILYGDGVSLERQAGYTPVLQLQ
ncbi:hypothetical protein R84B8_01838 [Treponema sp. R8-4-B8]